MPTRLRKPLIALGTALFLALVVFCHPSFSAFGLKKDGVNQAIVTDINLKGVGDSVTSDGSTLTFNLMSVGGGTSGATSLSSQDLTVYTGYSYIRKELSATAAEQDGGLPNGTPGQVIVIDTVAGAGGSFQITPVTSTTIAEILLDAVGETATLLYIDDTVGWVVLSTEGATIVRP